MFWSTFNLNVLLLVLSKSSCTVKSTITCISCLLHLLSAFKMFESGFVLAAVIHCFCLQVLNALEKGEVFSSKFMIQQSLTCFGKVLVIICRSEFYKYNNFFTIILVNENVCSVDHLGSPNLKRLTGQSSSWAKNIIVVPKI